MSKKRSYDWREVAKEFGVVYQGNSSRFTWQDNSIRGMAEEIFSLRSEVKRLIVWSSDSHVTDMVERLKAERAYSETLREALVNAVKLAEEMKHAGFGIGAPDSWNEALALLLPGESDE